MVALTRIEGLDKVQEQRFGNWVADVGEGDFQERVLAGSRKQPVLVDFWAEWCAPCRMLTPVLESLAEEFQGAFHLVRINVEEAPALARQFQIQSIPLVVLFRDGEPVDRFVGGLPEDQIRRFLRSHIPDETDEWVSRAEDLLARDDREGARGWFARALERQGNHGGALVGLAQLALLNRNLEETKKFLGQIDPHQVGPADQEKIEALKARLRFLQECQEFGDLERRSEETDSLESRYRTSCCLAAEERYAEALDDFLQIVCADRSFRDDGARRAMLDIFHIVGVRSQLADRYRSQLSRVIF